MSKTDKRFLERHGGKWRVVIPVPRNLQKKLGKTKLKRGLRTDSLVIANALKWSVIAELKQHLRLEARGTAAPPLLAEALMMREALGQDESDGQSEFGVLDAIGMRADELAGEPIDQDRETGDPIYNEERSAQAGYYYKIASGQETPLTALLGQWHVQTVNRKERTKGDDRRVLGYLDDWCKVNATRPTIEAVTRKVAGRFIGDLPTRTASARNSQRLANRTTNKYLSSLSAYWAWLCGRDMAKENVWRGQFLEKLRTNKEDDERPFTDDEVRTLLEGSPRMQTLHPLMRIACAFRRSRPPFLTEVGHPF